MSKTDISTTNLKARNKFKKACIENAKLLLLQANEQFRVGNYNLSTFLAITSYEESLKYGLLNSHKSHLISDEEYNKITSHHISKLLSEYAFIQITVEGKKIKQKYTLPLKSEYYNQIVKKIKEKRERCLYVDFNNSELNIPSNTNPADATEEINRAYKSIQDVTFIEILERKLQKSIRLFKNQEIFIPKPVKEA